MAKMIDGVLSWASDIEVNTIEQAKTSAKLPFVEGHVALMPDAHFGFGATVGSVIPTRGAIIPSAIGVDIGCGMCAAKLDLRADQLPDDLSALHGLIARSIPSGVGKGHGPDGNEDDFMDWVDRFGGDVKHLSTRQFIKAVDQFGTLGSGNHFVEICLDEDDGVWAVLHSGSRGVGNELATQHIDGAKGLMKKYFIELENPDLAYLVEGTPEFDAYIHDMLWAQAYAMESREKMMNALLESVAIVLDYEGHYTELQTERVNCHHNYTERESHKGKNLWITRKGAIRARTGDLGIIPGSMGACSYIVEGLGNPASYCSASHGAGRKMSRAEAKRTFSADDLRKVMGDREWDRKSAGALIDEHPSSYKDIDQVMEDQKDLVKIKYKLHQILNYKGA